LPSDPLERLEPLEHLERFKRPKEKQNDAKCKFTIGRKSLL
jgi:hypothetical protein